MSVNDIAKAHNVSPSMVYHLIDGRKKTTMIELAFDIAKVTGKLPIDHISDKLRTFALIHKPALGREVSHIRKVSKKA